MLSDPAAEVALCEHHKLADLKVATTQSVREHVPGLISDNT